MRIEKQNDLEFLIALDNKLMKSESVRAPQPNMSSRVVDRIIKFRDYRRDVEITNDELQRVFEVVRRNNELILYPHHNRFMFNPMYSVGEILNTLPGMPVETETRLSIHANQLPQEYNFKRMSEQFMNPENLRRAEFAGIKIENRESKYSY
ncbi:hypothetical protein J4481_00350 [Candidatus Pacearchaeota archaeon]|nr:hypothetical protein [Candidatus Pacearchaeota archaeon]